MNLSETHDPEVRRVLAIWNALGPPIRPSSKDIESYAEGWKAGEKLRVLIQGVTPELVDLALRKDAARVIAMDWSESYFQAMRQLGCEDWARVENWLNDWRVFVPELEESLDIVLGDGSLTLLSFPLEWEQVLKGIRRYLVPGGRIMLRLSFQPDEPFDLDFYLNETFTGFDMKCAIAKPEERLGMLRNVISETRIALGLVSARTTGLVDLNHRAELVHLFHAELAARCGHWQEWEIARVGIPPEADIRKGNRTGRAHPHWKAAVDLMEACGFQMKSMGGSGTRPAPGAMRLFVAERTRDKP
jgi:hypothetical protein